MLLAQWYLRRLYLLSICFGVTTARGSNTSSTCRSLTSVLPDRVFLPDTDVYLASIASYAYAQQQDQVPRCIVQPVSAEEVSNIVTTLRNSTTPFAIRSGGHSTNEGFSNIDNGITLDLTLMNSVTILEDGVTVSIETGNVWADVYPVLDARNRSLNGARASGVGVGGFLSGGGIGFFALQHGFACDAIVRMEVVLANGSIIEASELSNSDLFRAIKGGQSNFGIVTRWDLTTISQGQFWGGDIIYSNDTVPEQLAAFTNWKNPINFDPLSSVEQSHVYIGSLQEALVSTSLFYTKPVPYPDNLKNFTDIQPQLSNSTRFSNASAFSDEIQSFSTPDQYTIFASRTVMITPTILTKVHSAWQAYLELTSVFAPNITSSLTLQSIPAPPSDPSRANSLGFDPADTPQKDLVLILVSSFWDNSALTSQMQDATQSLFKDIESLAEDEGVLHNFIYENYAASSFQNPLQSTGNLEFFKEVAAKYDPSGMFQKQVYGGWKLH